MIRSADEARSSNTPDAYHRKGYSGFRFENFADDPSHCSLEDKNEEILNGA